MELKKLTDKVRECTVKYKYVILILCIGLVLMLIPGKSYEEKSEKSTSIEEKEDIRSISTELEEMIAHIDGAGETKVMLTTRRGEQTIYQSDQDVNEREDISESTTRTVTVTDGDRNEAGLIQQINPPVYQGAIVICKGADNPSVRLSIVDAVSKVTGLGANQISVLKMK